MNGTISRWLMAMAGLGALYLVVTHPQGVYKGAQALKTAVGGTETQIITGGRE